MSTRSTITVQQPDGTFKGVFCHWDGYISHVGVMLQRFYNSFELADKLVSMGSISSLYEKIGEGGELDGNSFESPKDKITTFYHRDRGEDLEINTFANINDTVYGNFMQEYDYVYRDEKWWVNEDGQWTTLINAILEDHEAKENMGEALNELKPDEVSIKSGSTVKLTIEGREYIAIIQ